VVVDTSAVLAILLGEPGSEALTEAAGRAAELYISAASYLEAATVLDRRSGIEAREMLDAFLAEFDIRVEPVTFEQAVPGRRAYELYGKGRHAAGLNYGDCFSYALAKVMGEELLFKGNDFSLTDVRRVG
jgi:ribonuclease VapC